MGTLLWSEDGVVAVVTRLSVIRYPLIVGMGLDVGRSSLDIGHWAFDILRSTLGVGR